MRIVAPIKHTNKKYGHASRVMCHISPITWQPLYAASAAMKIPRGLVMLIFKGSETWPTIILKYVAYRCIYKPTLCCFESLVTQFYTIRVYGTFRLKCVVIRARGSNSTCFSQALGFNSTCFCQTQVFNSTCSCRALPRYANLWWLQRHQERPKQGTYNQRQGP